MKRRTQRAAMKRILKLWAIVFAVGLAVPFGSAAAQATIINGAFFFTATGFGTGAPVDPVIGTVTYSFDNAANFSNVTTGVMVTNLNIAGTLGAGMSYVVQLRGSQGVKEDAPRGRTA